MTKNNEWIREDNMMSELPPLPAECRGTTRGLLLTATWDARVGPEVYLVLLEQGVRKGDTEGGAFQLSCDCTISKTDHGSVLLLLWTAEYDQGRRASYELFLDPHEMETIKLLSSLSQQTHLKVIVCDSLNERVKGRIEYENEFGIEQVTMAVIKSIAHEPDGDFELAKEQFRREQSIESLPGDE